MKSTILALALGASVAGCVSRGKYDAAIADGATKQRQAAALLRARDERINGLSAESLAQADKLRSCEAQTALASQQGRALREQLDGEVALNQSLKEELARAGKNADRILSEKGSVALALEQTKLRLEELRRSQAAAETRAALFRAIALKFKKMIDAGTLNVDLRDGRMVLVLANDVLFDSGKTELKPAGRAALEQVASVLITLPDRRFQVAGHTDNQPIHVSPFASNWELSTARGLVVVEFLVKHGMSADRLSAAGYGEFDPLTPNSSPDAMAKNRRTEIVVQPNIDEMVAVPSAPQ